MHPAITLSSVDLNRIDLLLDALPASHPFDAKALLGELARATVVEPWDVPPRVVTMNSTVCFSVGGIDGVLCRTLVYPKDAGNGGQQLSVLTPVGSALLGLAEGDAICWTHGAGKTVEVRVLEVLYQPERQGDFHL